MNLRFYTENTGSPENPLVYARNERYGPTGAQWAAEDCAEYYYSNCDGWEDKWPLEFYVEWDGEWHGFLIEREFNPTFYASQSLANAHQSQKEHGTSTNSRVGEPSSLADQRMEDN